MLANNNTNKNKNMTYVRISIYLILVIFTLNLSFSEEINPNSKQYLKLEIDNTISFKTTIDNKFQISEFRVFSYFFPTTYTGAQYLNSYETTHKDYTLINNSNNLYLSFNYNDANLVENNKINNVFILETNINRPEIKNKQAYPITNLNPEYKKYLGFSELIDYDENIKKQASTLANGESDVFIIASKTAKWIKEDINYNLSTVILNPNQKSSEVFKSKSGVCKEITNLYVSMMRSIGIPARVVSGYAYTNSPEVISYVGSNWGGHAWAEVLIGDTWVPFDLTYNEYGYVDATHIVLDKSESSQSKGVSINASGYGVNIVQGSLNTDTKFKIIDMKGDLFDEGFDIKIEGPEEIGFDSYGYMKITVANKEDFYKILFLKIAKPNEVELLDSSEKMTIFSPNEKKEIYYRYKISNLDPEYIYTFPFLIYTDFFNQTYNVTVRKDFLKIKEIALPKEEMIKTNYSNNKLEWNCNFILDSPNNIILCSIKNPNNYEINNMDVCINTECKKINLKLNEIKSITFDTNTTEEKINYIYDKENGNFKLEAVIPKLDFKYNTNKENFYFNYTILNYISELNVNLYLNDILISNSNYEEDELQFNLVEGNNTIQYKLVLKDKVLDSSTMNIFYEKETFIESPVQTSKTWFENIWNFILNLF